MNIYSEIVRIANLRLARGDKAHTCCYISSKAFEALSSNRLNQASIKYGGVTIKPYDMPWMNATPVFGTQFALTRRSLMNNRFFYYESPENGREVKIHFDSIEALAGEYDDGRKAEDMDDDSFYRYCDLLLGV